MIMETRPPTVGDNPVRAYNTILHSWDEFPKVPWSLDHKIWPEWIRVSDGKKFKTPDYSWIGEG